MKTSLTNPQDAAAFVAELSRQGIEHRCVQHSPTEFSIWTPPFPAFPARGVEPVDTRAFPPRVGASLTSKA